MTEEAKEYWTLEAKNKLHVKNAKISFFMLEIPFLLLYSN